MGALPGARELRALLFLTHKLLNMKTQVIISFRNETEVFISEQAIQKSYKGEVLKTADGLGLILPDKILDWGVILSRAGVPFRGIIRI